MTIQGGLLSSIYYMLLLLMFRFAIVCLEVQLCICGDLVHDASFVATPWCSCRLRDVRSYINRRLCLMCVLGKGEIVQCPAHARRRRTGLLVLFTLCSRSYASVRTRLCVRYMHSRIRLRTVIPCTAYSFNVDSNTYIRLSRETQGTQPSKGVHTKQWETGCCFCKKIKTGYRLLIHRDLWTH